MVVAGTPFFRRSAKSSSWPSVNLAPLVEPAALDPGLLRVDSGDSIPLSMLLIDVSNRDLVACGGPPDARLMLPDGPCLGDHTVGLVELGIRPCGNGEMVAARMASAGSDVCDRVRK